MELIRGNSKVMLGLHLHFTCFDSILMSISTLFLVLWMTFVVLFFRVKKKLREEYQREMKQVEKVHADKVDKLAQSVCLIRKRIDEQQKNYESDFQAKELVIIEFNQKFKRQEQHKQIESKHVYREIERLKQQINVIKKGYQAKLGMVEMEGLELKKHLKSLMFKV